MQLVFPPSQTVYCAVPSPVSTSAAHSPLTTTIRNGVASPCLVTVIVSQSATHTSSTGNIARDVKLTIVEGQVCTEFDPEAEIIPLNSILAVWASFAGTAKQSSAAASAQLEGTMRFA